MKKILVLLTFLLSIVYSLSGISHGIDPVLSDDPTEEQMQLVRDGAKDLCSEIDDENEAQMCVMDFYAQHNLEEEPSCD
jgi:chromosome condensin MukBEF MukE localization factor